MDKTPLWDRLWIHGNVACCDNEKNFIQDGAVASSGGTIAWVGPVQQLPNAPEALAKEVIDVQGLCLTPGLIDCHTHFIYGGNRANEFEMRLQGVSYTDIAKQGGGIKSTVKATREATVEQLLAVSVKRAKTILENGVTTLEVKSGYGLDLETEIKMLNVAQQVETMLPLTVKKTFLGAHTTPLEYQHNSDDYITLVCDKMIPEIAEKKLADAVDVFCETIAFNLEQTERVFATAKKYGLNIKCHAEQLSCSGAAALAASYGAVSVDHLEYLSADSIEKIAGTNTVAVLLPGAFYYLKETMKPPVQALRDHNIPIAVASDCNPGTSPILSLPLIMSMACTLYGLTPQEVLQAVTLNAAQALGINDTHGSLSVGKVADIAVWNTDHPRDLMYYLGGQPLHMLIKGGDVVVSNNKDVLAELA